MTSALRWAAMRAILMFHNCEGQSQDSVHRPKLRKSPKRRTEEDSNRGPASYQPNAFPLGQTGSHRLAEPSQFHMLTKPMPSAAPTLRH